MGQLEDMQTFVRIVETGSISSAAEELGIAKSAVSRRLAELEKRLSMTLIHRTTRSSEMTEHGQVYYSRSSELIKEISKLNSFSADPPDLLHGTLKLSVPVSFGQSQLVPVIGLFSKLHPQLILDVDLSNNQVDLIEGGFDLALRIGEKLKDSSIKARKIAQFNHKICASANYLKQYGIPKTPNDLKHHKLLKLSLNNTNSWNFFDKEGKRHIVNTPSKMASNNIELITAMAISGHGIARIPSFAVSEYIASAALVSMLEDYTSDDTYIYALYPQTRYLPQRVRLFIDFLAKRFEGDLCCGEHS